MSRRRFTEARYCDRDSDCAIQIILAILAPTPPGQQPRWGAFEARDREPESMQSIGCRVIVAGRQAWRPVDLIEDYMVRHEITETAARELVSGFPWHRSHIHESHTTTEVKEPHP